jgi:hypothetical protein
MDLGSIPARLPELTAIKEMLLARVYIFMEVRQHQGV